MRLFRHNRRFQSAQTPTARSMRLEPLEDRRLLAVELSTGAILWSRLAPGAAVQPLPPGGRFGPHYHADEDRE